MQETSLIWPAFSQYIKLPIGRIRVTDANGWRGLWSSLSLFVWLCFWCWWFWEGCLLILWLKDVWWNDRKADGHSGCKHSVEESVVAWCWGIGTGRTLGRSPSALSSLGLPALPPSLLRISTMRFVLVSRIFLPTSPCSLPVGAVPFYYNRDRGCIVGFGIQFEPSL